MLKAIKCIFVDFYFFLKHRSIKCENKFNFFYYFIVYVLIMIAAGIFRIGIPIIYTFFDVPMIQNVVSKNEIKPISFCWTLLFGVIIAPIIEELCFRYPLKYSKNNLSIGIIFFAISVFVTNLKTVNKLLNSTSFTLNPMFWVFISIALLFYIITRFNLINNIISKFWNKYLIVIIYVLSAYFALLHFPLPKTGINWVWVPVLVAPQFFMALYFSFIRLRVKFIYCVFLHMIINGIAILPQIFI